ncbi:MAG: hypothetical protein ACJ0A3_01380 [Dehalococcoidia bacterium]
MFKLAVLIPLLSIIIVATISIGLGVLFIALELYTPLHQWGSAIIGMALVVGLPALAFILQRKTEMSAN